MSEPHAAADYLEACRLQHPRLYSCLNPARATPAQIDALNAELGRAATHFESKLDGGRGDAYRAAQNSDFLNRSQGFLRLFDLATSHLEDLAAAIVLDALGGNGTLTRIVRACRSADSIPYIVTNDASARMIENALEQGLPAIRQPLQNLIWFDDCAFDAVIVAYGTHHIPPHERAAAIAEAYRVLKPGGRILVQDFEIGCPTTRWYSDTLDRYTETGHKFEYFSRAEFENLLSEFSDVEILNLYDPIISYGDTAAAARTAVLSYVLTLFALDKLVVGTRDERRRLRVVESVVRESSTFDPATMPSDANGVSEFCVVPDGGRYRAEIPRVALAAVGHRPL